MDNNLAFRYAERKDVPLILQFIRALAEYEKMADSVVADEGTLAEWIFDKHKAEVLFAVEDGQEVGFALFFQSFPAYLGRPGTYLDDLFVLPEHRGKGYGKALLRKVAATAVECGCVRLDWVCLNWNKPSLDFYRSLGATSMTDRTLFRVSGDKLRELAD